MSSGHGLYSVFRFSSCVLSPLTRMHHEFRNMYPKLPFRTQSPKTFWSVGYCMAASSMLIGETNY